MNSSKLQDVFLLCYSVVDTGSFEDIARKWHPELKRHRPNTPVLLVCVRVRSPYKSPYCHFHSNVLSAVVGLFCDADRNEV